MFYFNQVLHLEEQSGKFGICVKSFRVIHFYFIRQHINGLAVPSICGDLEQQVLHTPLMRAD